MPQPRRTVRGSVIAASLLFFWDAVYTGSFVASFLVCPVWLLISILKNAIERPGWRIAICRITIPALTLGLVMTNSNLQHKIAEKNAARVVAACEKFRSTTGESPKSLDRLVPEYLPSVPPAKYSLVYGDFMYWQYGKQQFYLMWCAIPPYGRWIYNSEDGEWGFLD